MTARDIIVIGASAGGVEALMKLVSSLPANLEAAVFVTLHTTPWGKTHIDSVLSRAGSLPAELARDGEPIRHGRILIAPPDRHLLIAQEHVHLDSGPKENRNRPAINVMLRSAALAYGTRVIGILLSGTLDDGTVGLWEIKRRGGVAIVQDPNEALFPDMPRNALNALKVDYTLPLNEMSGILAHWSRPSSEWAGPAENRMDPMLSEQTNLTCPECRGPVESIRGSGVQEFKCRVGHRYSGQTMLAAHVETEERTLWSGVVVLEEGADLAERLAKEEAPNEQTSLIKRAELCRKLAQQVREVIGTLNNSGIEQTP